MLMRFLPLHGDEMEHAQFVSLDSEWVGQGFGKHEPFMNKAWSMIQYVQISAAEQQVAHDDVIHHTNGCIDHIATL